MASRAATVCAARTGDTLAEAEYEYAVGSQLDEEGNPQCIDHYLRAVVSCAGRIGETIDPESRSRNQDVYHASLSKLLATSQAAGCIDWAQRQLVTPQGERLIIRYYGFPWRPVDFGSLELVGDNSSTRLRNSYGQRGLGVPLVIRSAQSLSVPYVRPQQPFAATAVLQLENPNDAVSAGGSHAVLAMYDPLRLQAAQVNTRLFPLETDISAPIVFALANQPQSAWETFIRQDEKGTTAGLYQIEPHQPGKIPVVFIHGLLSNRQTWASLANELRGDAGVCARYEFWAFEYPTGQSFLRSAADLRRQLRQARLVLDPGQRDPAWDRMVLVGHSMGGLIAKLQVTYSGDALWRAVADRPLSLIQADPSTKSWLSDSFYFQPLPSVRRVIFIGTPHRGSPWARRLVGRAAEALVEEPTERVQQHERLIVNNPGVFIPEVEDRIPTSVDVLAPENPLLQAMEYLPFSPDVQLHSIVGTGRWMVAGGPADGVVPVAQRRTPRRCQRTVRTGAAPGTPPRRGNPGRGRADPPRARRGTIVGRSSTRTGTGHGWHGR